MFPTTLFHGSRKTKATQGFTLVELIVAAAVSLTILSVALGVMAEQRRWILSDRTRQAANDNLRLASDFIGQDIREAGEQLSSNTQLPGISILPATGSNPTSTLVLQRLLVAAPLPVCQSISAGTNTSTIDVSAPYDKINGTDYGSLISNCPYSSTGTAATPPPYTDNLKNAWQSYRLANGGTVWGYIYQPPNPTAVPPIQGHGEFFKYIGETSSTCATPSSSILSSTSFPAPPAPLTTRTCQKIQIQLVNSASSPANTWQYSYTYNTTGPVTDPTQPQLYILEERKYSAIPDPNPTPNLPSNITPYILQLTVNRQTPTRIANNLSGFDVFAKVPPSYSSKNGSNWGCANIRLNPASPTQWYCTAFNVDRMQTYTDPTLSQQYINNWQDLQGVRVNLLGINPNTNLLQINTANANNALTLSSEFFPRNILSKTQ